MKIYTLIHEQDTDCAWGSSVSLFKDKVEAAGAMMKEWDEVVKSWGFLPSDHITEEHHFECFEDRAEVRDDDNIEAWRIEEQEIGVRVAVEVVGGLVQNIYADADISADVFDLDTSDFSDDCEITEADRLEAELKALISERGWMEVW